MLDVNGHSYVLERGCYRCGCKQCEGAPLTCIHCGSASVDPGYSGVHSCADCGQNFREEQRPLRKAQAKLLRLELRKMVEDLDT